MKNKLPTFYHLFENRRVCTELCQLKNVPSSHCGAEAFTTRILLDGKSTPDSSTPFHAGNNRGEEAFLSVCSAHFLAALLFLFCICYFKRVHNASIFRLLLNAIATEARTQ